MEKQDIKQKIGDLENFMKFFSNPKLRQKLKELKKELKE